MLENQSGPGGLHENTLLVVMGDHGQTLNGDHGGGSAEEVCVTNMVSVDIIFLVKYISPPPPILIRITSCRWKLPFLP